MSLVTILENGSRSGHGYIKMQENNHETLLAGAEYQDAFSDLQWALRGPNGNWAIRLLGFVLRKAFRKGCSSITFDRLSFEQAMEQVSSDHLLVLAPTHRSMMDFLVCSYLCYAHPELKISIPYIAADLQLGKLPFLGWLLKQAYAFYIKRGQGKADPELNAQLQQLVAKQQTLEIFIEGTRSRARQCLHPKRGLLRALQQTGVACSLLPITINYDRVPEEEALVKELHGGPKPLMRLGPLLKWCAKLIKGNVQIGRVHMVCGEPVHMHSDSDVKVVSYAIMKQLQENYVVSSFHLQAFLHHHPSIGFDIQRLTRAIQERGGTVIQSPLKDVTGVDRLTEYSFRYQWMHLFFSDLLAQYSHHPILDHHIQINAFSERYRRTSLERKQDQHIQVLLQTLFEPLEQVYAKLFEALSQETSLPFEHPKAFVKQHPECFLPMVEEALAHLTAAQLIMKTENSKGFVKGEAWDTHASLYLSPLWEPRPQAPDFAGQIEVQAPLSSS